MSVVAHLHDGMLRRPLALWNGKGDPRMSSPTSHNCTDLGLVSAYSVFIVNIFTELSHLVLENGAHCKCENKNSLYCVDHLNSDANFLKQKRGSVDFEEFLFLFLNK